MITHTNEIFGWLSRLSHRQWSLLGLFGCVAMELSAVYFQFVVGLVPCPLCITQRMIIFVTALVFLAAAIHNPTRAGIRIYSGLGLLITLFGMGVAIYHFVIQLLPSNELASCGPGASYILKHMELTHAIRLFLTGAGDCREIVWSLFGLSMPFWVALCFAGLVAIFTVQLVVSKGNAKI